MRCTWFTAGAVALASFAAPAIADDGCEGGVCLLPVASAARAPAPSAREIQSAVDAYLASARSDAALVGGPGSAGYDGGFWIRGGSFLLKINLTIQTRFEYFDWDDRAFEPSPGGDLSGFSLPRLTLKLSGDVLCDMHYYAELEFGHLGSPFDNDDGATEENFFWLFAGGTAGIESEQAAKDLAHDRYSSVAREAWIEWEACPSAAIRMGLVRTAATRQLMTPPEMQQFVDVSLASAIIGQSMPGYTSRNRDYGLMVHGALGCDAAWSYLATITNGDGPVHRNVLDGSTDDPLAYSARLNWDVKGHTGYEEGALRQHGCEWTAAVGAWIHYFVDHDSENPIDHFADRLTWGVDAAVGWGGLSVTAAYSAFSWDPDSGSSVTGWTWLVQAGYLFPDTAWEVAARVDQYFVEQFAFGGDAGAMEWGVAVSYYVDGHGNKLTADASFVASEEDGNVFGDTMAGYSPTYDSDGMLLRFQWQLAL